MRNKMQLLFVDCCMRERSRTKALCNSFLQTYCELHPEEQLVKRDLKTSSLQYYTEEEVLQREHLLKEKAFHHPMFTLAREFAAADKIVIGAPYWDLSFPALLKIYFETIFVNGIAFRYQDGAPVGMCNAQKLLFITTAGGFIEGCNYGCDYICGVCKMLGIPSFSSIKAEGLDIIELDTQELLYKAEQCAHALARIW